MKASMFVCSIGLFFLCSCIGETINIVVELPNYDGISIGEAVKHKREEVGEIVDIQMIHDSLCYVSVALDPRESWPNDTKFAVEITSFFGAKYLVVKKGISKESLATGDTIQGTNPVDLFDVLSDEKNSLLELLNEEIERDSLRRDSSHTILDSIETQKIHEEILEMQEDN